MLVQMLLERGARPDICDTNGKTALAIAQDLGFDNIMHLFSQAVLSKNATASSPYYQYRPLSSPTSIRLLELHPADTESDTVSFTLFEVDLDKTPYYETLSYEWGEPAGSVTALCNGKPMLLTPNLKQAMIRIRSSLPRPAPSSNSAATNQGRILWIDAVCINQASLPERSHQVSLMKRIYYEAKSTIFYLGPSNSLIASAVKNLSLLSQQFDVLSREVPEWSPLCYDSLQVPDTIYLDKILPLWETILSDPDCVESLYDIFGRTYFTRAWIVQEILLSCDGTAVLSNSPNLHNTLPKSEELSIPWKDLLHALWALEFGARYRLIEQFPISDPKFREILMITRRFRWLKNLIASWSVSTGQRLVKYPVLMGLESLGPYKATDPRDKVYASPGFMHRFLPVEAEAKPESDTTLPPQERGGEFKADYSLTVQQVYTNAVRCALFSDDNNRSSRTTGRLDNMGKYMRPYDKKRLPGLPSWVPDWSRPIWTIKPSTAFSVGHLLDGNVEITCINPAHNRHLETNDGRANAKLFVNGIIIDRVTQVVPLTRDTPVSDIFKLVTLMLHFEHNGTSILNFYPHMTTVSCEDKPITYLAALWDAITSENKELHTPERTRDIMGFLLSHIIDDEKIPESVRNQLLQQRTEIMECTTPKDKIVDLGKGDLFLEEYDWMERQVWRGDLVITSRGGFGITNGLEVADKGMVVALVGGADEVYLLRQHNEEDQDQGGTSQWYEFVDVVDVRHMRRYFGAWRRLLRGRVSGLKGWRFADYALSDFSKRSFGLTMSLSSWEADLCFGRREGELGGRDG
ncbi:Heterokaryon incompatibility protein (HET) domain containing protein [Rhypophila decipiens]